MYKHYLVLLVALIVGTDLVHAQRLEKSSSNSELTMLVGTYTEGSTSKGVYVYRFNQETGKAKMVSFVQAGNPSFVVAKDDNKFAYSVSEYNDGRQSAIAYRLDKAKGKLSLINSQTTTDEEIGVKKGKDIKTDGADPCFIMTNGKQVVTANYSGGDISVFPIAKDGSLCRQSQHFCFSGNEQGIVSHLHCVRLTPDGKYLVADDLGNDCIYRFEVNSQADYLNRQPFLLNPLVIYKGEKGRGPRHIVFSKNGRYAYLISELGDVVTTFSYESGRLKEIQAIVAYDGGGHGSADIHISPNGKFLYTSHRLKNDGVSIFRINQTTGMLTKVGYQRTGIHPRNFSITPNGKYFLVACRDSNEIEVFSINKQSGLLKDTFQRIKLDKPVCIQFLK